MMMNNPLAMLQTLRQNPMQFLMQRRMNLPQGMNMQDPQAILNHLMQTGQVSQDQVNRAWQMAQQFKR